MADDNVVEEVVAEEAPKAPLWSPKGSNDGVWVKMIDGPTSYSMQGDKFTLEDPVQCVPADIVNMLLATGSFVKTARPK